MRTVFSSKGRKNALCVLLACIFIVALGMVFVSCGKTPSGNTDCEHVYVDDTRIEPTCTEEGSVTRKCSKCGDTIEEVIPATGHNFVNGECTVCHLQEDLAQSFYENMLDSLIMADSFSIRITDLRLSEISTYKIFEDGKKVFGYEKVVNETSFLDVAEAVFSIDENGNLKGAFKGVLNLAHAYDDSFNVYTTKMDIKAVLQDGMIYAVFNQTYGDIYQDTETSPMYVKAPAEGFLADFFSAVVGDDMDETVGMLMSLSQSGKELAELLKGQERELGIKAEKLIIDMLFDRTAVDGGYTFNLNPARLKKYVDMLANSKIADIIDNIFGENTTAKVSAFILAAKDKTLATVLEELKGYGFDYEEIIAQLDEIMVSLVGEDFSANVNEFIEAYKETTIKAILAEAMEVSEDEVSQIISVVVSDIKEMSVIDFVVKYFAQGKATKAELIADLTEMIDDVASVCKYQKIAFTTDETGKIVSFNIDLKPIVEEDDEDEEEGGASYTTSGVRTSIIAKIDVLFGEHDEIEECADVIEKADQNQPKFDPETQFVTNVQGEDLKFTTDKNGEIIGVEFDDPTSLPNTTIEFIYVSVLPGITCKPWVAVNVVTRLYNDKGNSILYLNLYYNTENKGLTESDNIHSYDLLEEESDLTCGGYVTLQCSKCGAKKTLEERHSGNAVVTYELLYEDATCDRGLYATARCSDCDEIIDKEIVFEGHIMPDDDNYEEIEFDNCGENNTANIVFRKTCPCGYNVEYTDRIGCNYSIVTSYYEAEDSATDAQEQIDGLFDPLSYNGVNVRGIGISTQMTLTCKDCGYEIYETFYWKKAEGCKIELHDVWSHKKGDEIVVVKDYVYAVHAYHDYESSEIINGTLETCRDCGSYVKRTEVETTYEGGVIGRETRTVRENKSDETADRKYEYTEKRLNGKDLQSYEYEKTIVDRYGEYHTVWERNVTEDCYVPEVFSYGYRTFYENSNGYSREMVYGVLEKPKFTSECCIYEYIKHPDGEWEKATCTYDFAAGCLVTRVYSNSRGQYEETVENSHRIIDTRVVSKETCAQEGCEQDICEVCNSVVETRTYPPKGHSFVRVESTGEYACVRCGAFRDGYDVDGIMTTEDITDYSESELYYTFVYYNPEWYTFEVLFILRQKKGLAVKRAEYFLDINSMVISNDKGEISIAKELVNAKIDAKVAELGLNRADYDFTVMFACVSGEIDEEYTGYRELYNKYTYGNTIDGEGWYRFHVESDKMTKITITVPEGEKLTWKIYSLSDSDTFAELYNEDETEILARDDDGGENMNFLIEYEFDGGVTYTLKVRFYGGGMEGYVTVIVESATKTQA